MEKGGVTVDGRSSGVAGIGPRYKAALETAETAKRHAQEASSSWTMLVRARQNSEGVGVGGLGAAGALSFRTSYYEQSLATKKQACQA